MKEGIEKRDKSVARHYRRNRGHSDSEEEFQVSFQDEGPGRSNERGISRSRSRDRSPGGETVLSRILGRETSRGVRGTSERNTPMRGALRSPSRDRRSRRDSRSKGPEMTMTEILQCFPDLKPGETPPDYVHRLHRSGVDEKMLRNMKISKMVALNKGITLPKSMTLWEVKQVKSLSLGKDSLDELKQKCAEEVLQGKSTLCLAIANLEEAGATDLQMEDFLIQLPGGEGLAVSVENR